MSSVIASRTVVVPPHTRHTGHTGKSQVETRRARRVEGRAPRRRRGRFVALASDLYCLEETVRDPPTAIAQRDTVQDVGAREASLLDNGRVRPPHSSVLLRYLIFEPVLVLFEPVVVALEAHNKAARDEVVRPDLVRDDPRGDARGGALLPMIKNKQSVVQTSARHRRLDLVPIHLNDLRIRARGCMRQLPAILVEHELRRGALHLDDPPIRRDGVGRRRQHP